MKKTKKQKIDDTISMIEARTYNNVNKIYCTKCGEINSEVCIGCAKFVNKSKRKMRNINS